MKIISIEFRNGEVWTLDAKHIAEHRAHYYATKDCKENPKLHYHDEYLKEYEYCINDSFELIYWLNNNLNWKDIREFAAHEQTTPINYDEAFSSAHVSLREYD